MSTIEQTQPMSEIVQDYRKRLMVFGGRASGQLAAHIGRNLQVEAGSTIVTPASMWRSRI